MRRYGDNSGYEGSFMHNNVDLLQEMQHVREILTLYSKKNIRNSEDYSFNKIIVWYNRFSEIFSPKLIPN